MTDARPPEPRSEPSTLERWLSGGRVAVAALVVAVVALIVAVAPYASGGDFNARVRTYLVEHPEVLQEASDALNARAQLQQAALDRQKAAEISARVAANPALLTVDARDAAFGPTDARVTVIEFFDFRCPGCKATAPEVLRLMQAHPDVRFVFKDWPILDGPSDGLSHHAARAAQAAHRQGQYLPVFRALMAEPALSESRIDAILTANGVALPQAEAAMAGPEIARHLADIQTSATVLGLVGTPTFFVNGKAMDSIQPAALDASIRKAKAG